jgi:hypothetical protein
LVALALTSGRYRQLAAIIATIIVGIAIGLATNPTKTTKMAGRLLETVQVATEASAITPTPATAPTPSPVSSPTPAIACVADPDNSTTIRIALAEQAIKRIDVLAPVGHGVGSFAAASCLKTYSHNIVLQAADELGMIGATLLLILIVLAFRSVIPLVRFDSVARFIFASLVFVAFESLVSGSLTGATLLFALIAWSTGLNAAGDQGPSELRTLGSPAR